MSYFLFYGGGGSFSLFVSLSLLPERTKIFSLLQSHWLLWSLSFILWIALSDLGIPHIMLA